MRLEVVLRDMQNKELDIAIDRLQPLIVDMQNTQKQFIAFNFVGERTTRVVNKHDIVQVSWPMDHEHLEPSPAWQNGTDANLPPTTPGHGGLLKP